MAVGDAKYAFPCFLTPVLTQLFFPKPRLLFSHASAEMRGKISPESNVASTGDHTQNHQVMSLTLSTEPTARGLTPHDPFSTLLRFYGGKHSDQVS